MLPQLSSSHGYGQSIHLYPYGMKHAPSVVFVSGKTVIAWQYIIHVGNMLRQLSSSQYIGKSMIIPP